MKMIKNIYIVLIALITFSAYAQERNLKSSNADYDKYAFVDAQGMYLNVVNNGYESMEVFQKLGDTYYFNNDYKNAHKWYSRLFEYDSAMISKEYYFRYIQSLKAVKDYDKANQLMAEYQRMNGSDSMISSVGNGLNYLDLIEMQSWRYNIKNEGMNSKSQDFGTSYYLGSRQVVFASSRDSSSMVSRKHKWSNREFLDLYIADADSLNGTLSNVRKFGDGDEELNTKFHESNAVFTKDGNTVYYTSNNYLNKEFKKSSDDVNKLKIFRATKSGEGWSNIQELHFNSDEWSTAHPALNKEENRLYFASNRPESILALDGKNSSDIWYSDIGTNGELSDPINLASVNTPGREFFPFISNKGDLYFSSTGHAGLGGLDVFVANLESAMNDQTFGITNIGKPVNGPYDDFAFIINDNTKTGYFSSNRREGNGLDDIYSFKQTKSLACKDLIEGVVTDSESGALMPGTQVSILDGDNKVMDTVVVGLDAAYSFEVNCGTTYSLRGVKDGYDPVDAVTETPGMIATIDLPLQIGKSVDEKMDNVQVGDNLVDVLGMDWTIIYFDFDKSNIRPDAEVELQLILNYMLANPTVEVDIRSHTDSRAPDGYNIKLSDRRAKSTRAYLIMKGISANRLTAAGYGEFQLVNECSNGVDCTEEQHQLNRRSEFIVTKK